VFALLLNWQVKTDVSLWERLHYIDD